MNKKAQVVVKQMNKNILSIIIVLVLNHLQYDLVHKDLWCLFKAKSFFFPVHIVQHIWHRAFQAVITAFLFQTMSYNRHSLAADASEKQAKEILIRRRHSLRESLRKTNSLSRERPVLAFCGVFWGFFFLNFNFYFKQLFVANCHTEKTVFWHAGKNPEFGRQLHI